MAYKMKDFLIQYFSQKRFDDMSPGVRAQYDDFVKNGDMTGHMKAWHNDYEGHAVPNPEDSTVISEDELAKLYKEFLAAFSSLDAKREKLENSVSLDDRNSKILSFMKDYFGPGKLFEPTKATPEAEEDIEKLISFLDQNNQLDSFLSQSGIIESQKQYKAFIDDLTEKKYNSDQDLKQKIIGLVSILQFNKEDLKERGIQVPTLTNLTEEKFDQNTYTTDKATEFREKLKFMLDTLYSNKKIREAFPATSVTSAFDTAKSQVAYDDANSKDYVPEKPDDKLSWTQAMSKWVGDTYDNTLAKYIKFRGDTLYFSLHAKQMVAALSKVGIKPTDGLEKILEEKSKIQEKLATKPQARENMNWMFGALEEVQKTKPEAFKSALRNGRQMRAIVGKIIAKAVKEDKMDAAKATLEVLAVSKYGYTTSKIMDKLNGELDKFSVLSDPNMSWNKGNECMQMITSAMDKSVAFALKGVGLGITTLGNIWHMRGSKFKGRADDEMHQQHDAWNTEHTNKINKIKTDQRYNTDAQAQSRVDMTNTGITDLVQAENDANALQILVDERNSYQQTLDSKTATVSQYEAQKQNLDNKKDKLSELADTITHINNELASQTPNTPEYQVWYNRLMKVYEEKIDLEAEIRSLENDWNNSQMAYHQAQLDRQTAENDFNAHFATHGDVIDQYNQQMNKIATYKAAEKRIAELQATETELAADLDKEEARVSPYLELAAYWDMLETGRGLHTGPMYNWFRHLSAKSAQKSFNARAPQIEQQYLQKYLDKYGMAA